MKDIWLWVALGVLGLLVLLIAQDLWVYTQGGDSIIGDLLEGSASVGNASPPVIQQDVVSTETLGRANGGETQETTLSHTGVLSEWESVATLERLEGSCDPDTLRLILAFPEYITNFEPIDREKDVYFWVYENAGQGDPVRRAWAQYLARERHIGKLSSLAVLIEEYKTPEEARRRTASPQFKPGDSFPTGRSEWTWTIGGGSREFVDEDTVYYDAGHLMGAWSAWFASGAKGIYRVQVAVLCFYNYAFAFEYGEFNTVNAYSKVLKRLSTHD